MKLRLSFFLIAMGLFFNPQQQASANTYQINDTFSAIVTGTITTDGTTGLLSADNIIDYDLSAFDGNVWFSVSATTDANVYFGESTSSPTVAGTSIYFDFDDPLAILVLTDNITLDSICLGVLCAEATASSAIAATNLDGSFSFLAQDYEIHTGNLAFATIAPVPIPAALPLLGFAMVALTFMRRRRLS